MFIRIGEQSINLSLVARIEWHQLEGKLNGATLYYQNGVSVRYQKAEAEQLLAHIQSATNVTTKK